MQCARQIWSSALVLLLVACLLTVGSCSATSISAASPEFSVKYVDGSYTTREGNIIENKTVYVIIQNQPFAPYNDENGKTINVYYDILWKNHLDADWSESFHNQSSSKGLYVQESGSDYTAVALLSGGSIPDVGQLDFKVQALVGYYNVTHVHYLDDHNGHTVLTPYNLKGNFVEVDYDVYTFFGEENGSSSLQTLSIPDGDTSQTTTPSDSPNRFFDTLTSGLFEIDVIQLVVIVFISVVIGMVLAVGITRKFRRQ